jgi:adenylate kinase family enzyme
MIYRRLHIVGASGSGTSTLGEALATKLGIPQFDADRYYWLPTTPPFREKRAAEDRRQMLLADLARHDRFILSGAVMGWGDEIEHAFDLVVFLSIPADLRLARLRARELLRYGQINEEFISWAAAYEDDAPFPATRNRRRQEAWLATRNSSVLRLEGDLSVAERVAAVVAHGRRGKASAEGKSETTPDASPRLQLRS